MKITDILPAPQIKIGLRSRNKQDLFEEMVQLLVDARVLRDREAALRALFEREARMTTGVAKWLGLPHGKLDEARGLLVALGTSAQGIDYDSMDGEPVYVVVLVLAEAGNPGPHIDALAEISRLFSVPGFTSKIMAAKTPAEVVELIRREE